MPGKRRRGRSPQQDPTLPAPLAVRKSRRELRADRRRQQRRRLGVVGIVGVVIAALAVAAAVGFGVERATSGGHHKPFGQTTLLLSVAGADGTAVETALLAHDDRTNDGVELLIPGRVLTEVCGFGNQQLGQILALPNGQELSRSTVSDLLGGVTVGGSWVLTTEQLARLVDAVGGVTVDVDVDVIQQRADGSRVLVVGKGAQQHLTGARAAAFATYQRSDEDALANLVRLQGVLDGIEAALPRDKAAVGRIVRSLGAGAQSSLGVDRLSAFLIGLAADARQNKLLPSDLPVIKIDSGGGQPAYRVDTQQTAAFVDGNLAASLPASARTQHKRVFVQNGVGTPGLVVSACSKLVRAGFAFSGSGNATTFGYKTSKVLVFDRTVASAELGDNVARVLGLPTNDVAVSTTGQNIADVLVILGKDYKP